MPLNVLIAPDKFKGTLTAPEAAAAMARGWSIAQAEDRLVQSPISDGGDGFGPLLAKILNGILFTAKTQNAVGQAVDAEYWITPDGTALIESANTIGLAMLKPRDRRPMENDSAGLGIVLQEAIKAGASRAIVGIGGSATNDGGFGIARQLGWQFLDAAETEITHWPDLARLATIWEPDNVKAFKKFTVAVDVQNPLLGADGCTRVYGPQKGLTAEDFPKAESALERLAEVWRSQTGEDATNLPGSGAAGGLGFGLHCFMGAVIRPGFELFAEASKLEAQLAAADVVLTGEGAMDRQTVMGKGVGELAKLAHQHDCDCIGLAGVVEDRPSLDEHFHTCLALTELTEARNAKQNAAEWLEKLANETAMDYRN